MRAIVVSSYGSPEVLQLAEVERPTPLATEVLVAGIAVEPDGAGLEQLTALVEQGKLRVHVDQVVPLAEAARAHAALPGITGKIVLSV